MSPRWFSLGLFIVQHALLTIALRYSAMHSDPENIAISSTEVVLTEATKLGLSVLVSFLIDAKGSTRLFGGMLEKAFVDEGMDLVKLGVPAVLYTIQNNLQYTIEQAPLFLVMYQLKIITTAFFFSHMLARRLTGRDWATITALALGVAMVQVHDPNLTPTPNPNPSPNPHPLSLPPQSSQTDVHIHHASNLIGLLCVVFACTTSGFAGVYFEKTLKVCLSLTLTLTLTDGRLLRKDAQGVSKP